MLVNLLHLCHPCHMWITVNPDAACAPGAGWAVRQHEDPAAVPVLHWMWGLVLLTADGGFGFTEPQAA